MKPEKNEQPLPSDWANTTFGEIAEYITSGSRDWSKYYSDHGAMFIRTQDINTNRLRLDDVARVALPEKVEGKRTRVIKGDVLITITGANVGKVALVENDIEEAYVSQSVALVRLKDKRVGKFLHYQLMTKFRGDKTHLESMAYGLGRPVLNLDNIRDVPIRLTTVDRQKRIVAEIERQFSRLDEAVANLKRVKANLKRYKAAVLKAAVEGELTEEWRKAHPDVEPAGELLKRVLAERRARWNGKGNYKEPMAPETTTLPLLPQGWIWASLDQLFVVERGRFSVRPRNDPEYYNGTHAFVQIGDLPREGGSVLSYSQTLNDAGLAVSKKFRTGTVLIAIVGATIANTGILTFDSCAPDSLVAIQSESDTTLRFAELYLRSIKLELRRASYASGGQPNINLGTLLPLSIPFPSLPEQELIVDEVERRFSVVKEEESVVTVNLQRADRLKRAVLARAFSGRLLSSWQQTERVSSNYGSTTE